MPAFASTQAAFRRSRRVLTLGVATVVVIAVATATVGVIHLRQSAEALLGTTTRNLTQSLDLTVASMVDTIDVALQASADEISRELSARKPDGRSITRYLVRQQHRLARVAYLRATNERGDVIYGPDVLSPPSNNADRDYFIRLRDDAKAGMLVVKPVLGRISGKWVWSFARRISKPDGSFGGVVFAAIYVNEIERFLAQVKLGPGDSIALRDGELGLIARYPPAASIRVPVGDRRLAIPFQEALKVNPREGTYISGETSIDGISRTHSYRRNAKYGYTVNVGVAQATILSAWQKQAAGIGGLTLLFILGSLAYSWLISSAWRRQEESMAALEASGEALQQAQGLAGLGTYVYDLRADVWISSAVLDGIFGIDGDYRRDARHWLELVEPASREEMQAHLDSIIEQRRLFDHEYGIVRPRDGLKRWVHGKGKLELDAQGNPLTLHGTIQDITERHEMEQALLARQSELREIYQSLQTAREEERHRLARELHDDLGQRVTALRMDLEWVDYRLTTAPPAIIAKMAGVNAQIDELADSIRRLTEDMRPGLLDTLGLVTAVKDYASKFSARTGINCKLTASPDEIKVDDQVGIGIYRIVQEALNNVQKHSRASRVALALRRTDHAIALEIADNGVGLPETDGSARKGFGLLGMRERIAILNGRFSMTSRPDQGVRIEVVIPL